MGIASWTHRLGSAGCNYPARVLPLSPMALLQLRPPQATSALHLMGSCCCTLVPDSGSLALRLHYLLFPFVISTALALSSESCVRPGMSLECGKGRGEQLTLIAASWWTNSSDKGWVTLMARSPFLWVRVQ